MPHAHEQVGKYIHARGLGRLAEQLSRVALDPAVHECAK